MKKGNLVVRHFLFFVVLLFLVLLSVFLMGSFFRNTLSGYQVLEKNICGNGYCEEKENNANCEVDCLSYAVFVTSLTYEGNLGGVDGADALCNLHAQAAGRGKIWKAYLGNSTVSAQERLFRSDAPYANLNNILFSKNWSALNLSMIVSPMDIDEGGRTLGEVSFWTGNVANKDLKSSDVCSDWNSNSSYFVRGAGSTSTYWFALSEDQKSLTSWDGGRFERCNEKRHLICVEQPENYFIDRCTQLTQEGYYALGKNIQAKESCIILAHDSIHLDGLGRSLFGEDEKGNVGILSFNQNNLSISNLQVLHFDSGLMFKGIEGGILTSLETSNNDHGIVLSDSSGILLRNGLLLNNSANGLSLYSIRDSQLINTTSAYNGYGGIYTESGLRNSFEDNSIFNNSFYGIALFYSSENSLIKNRIFDNSYYGVFLSTSSGNILQNNYVYQNTNDGVVLASTSTGNRLEHNYIQHNGRSGVSLSWSTQNAVRDNLISSNADYGIDLGKFAGENILERNTDSGEANGKQGVVPLQASNENTYMQNSFSTG